MIFDECPLNIGEDDHELEPHGTLAFPCAGYSLEYLEDVQEIIPWHWHEELEVIYAVNGKVKVQIPGKVFIVEQGESIFINSNILHSAEAEPFCRYHSIVFHPLLITGSNNSVFAMKYITPLIHFTCLDGYKLTTQSEWEKKITEDIAEAHEAISLSSAGYEFVVREKLTRVCLAFYQQYEQDIEKGHAELNQDVVRLRKMMNYIHEHYMEGIDLSQIAKTADIGERECLRCFRRLIKVSPIQYLIKHRVMQGATMLLRNRDMSITDISIHCGFESPSNFSQMFKRFFRCSPREYRSNVA